MMDDIKKREKEESQKTGKTVLLALLGFFLVFCAVDALFVYMAISTNTGLVIENPYETGLHYNKIIAEAKKKHHDQRSTIDALVTK